MSIEALNWALKQPLHGCRKFVLVVLAYHANNTNQCWPGLKIIAEECGITRSSVINHLKEIVKLGLIEKEKRFDDRGYRRSTLYKLHLDQGIETQRKNSQRGQVQRRAFESQGQDFGMSKVKDLDGNIIERSLEQTIEQTNTSEVITSSDLVPIKTQPANTEEIFNYWQSVMKHPRAKLDSKRQRRIAQALKLGYSVEELKQAINGCALTPYNMGRNDQNQRYDDIELILRDASHIDRFIANAISPPVTEKNKISTTDLMTGVVL